MPAARAGELQGPVGYDPTWLVLTIGALALVLLYGAAVLWWTRTPGPGRARRAGHGPGSREQALRRLDEVAAAVAAGQITAREGHRQVSEVVRAHAAALTGLPATTMTLDELRRTGPPALAEVVALVYPPEFAPGEQLARDRLDEALRRARALVAGSDLTAGGR